MKKAYLVYCYTKFSLQISSFLHMYKKKRKSSIYSHSHSDSNEYYAAEKQILLKRVFKKIMDKKLTIL